MVGLLSGMVLLYLRGDVLQTSSLLFRNHETCSLFLSYCYLQNGEGDLFDTDNPIAS